MKSTGLVRRIDDLGRVIIPKDIRRIFDIREGDALNVYIQNNCIVFEKHDESKDICIIRRIDDLGRIVVPKDIRHSLKISYDDPLEIFTTREGQIMFKKYVPGAQECVFCGGLTDRSLLDKPVCTGCLNKIDQMYRR
jgi:AbrB family looped-hinge helix DNA binding protein